MKKTNEQAGRFVVCIRNDDYVVSLEKRKIYQLLPDPDAAAHHQVRVVDESGEDYLYPEECFIPIDLPDSAKRALLEAA